MVQFRAFDSNVEVNGESVLAIVNAMSIKQRMLRTLAECGIVNPRPGAWYPQQACLDAFRAVAEDIGPTALFCIGKGTPTNSQLPPQINSIEAALSSINLAYHMNHRGGEIGCYDFRETGVRSGTIVCHNPYPCEFDRGIIEAMAMRFRPDDCLRVEVVHDDSKPCRKNGSLSCTYHVRW